MIYKFRLKRTGDEVEAVSVAWLCCSLIYKENYDELPGWAKEALDNKIIYPKDGGCTLTVKPINGYSFTTGPLAMVVNHPRLGLYAVLLEPFSDQYEMICDHNFDHKYGFCIDCGISEMEVEDNYGNTR